MLRKTALRDPAALAELHGCFADHVYSLAYKMLQNHEEAEEVLQDVFVRVWKRSVTFDPQKSSAFTWVIMIARGLSLDRLRSRSRKKELMESWKSESADTTASDPDSSRQSVLSSELSDQISVALGKLPSKQRESLELAFYKGLTQGEIAERTREPLGTIKARIRRGMFKLRELLKDVYA